MCNKFNSSSNGLIKLKVNTQTCQFYSVKANYYHQTPVKELLPMESYNKNNQCTSNQDNNTSTKRREHNKNITYFPLPMKSSCVTVLLFQTDTFISLNPSISVKTNFSWNVGFFPPSSRFQSSKQVITNHNRNLQTRIFSSWISDSTSYIYDILPVQVRVVDLWLAYSTHT